jgi:N-acetylneuraminic acid mutarotase
VTATNIFTATGSLITARGNHIGTLLLNGQVLVAGGTDTNFHNLESAELYNPVTGTWNATGFMVSTRVGHTMTLLPNGNVLVAGGTDINGNNLASAELYNPATGTWSSTGSMTNSRIDFTATLLTNGLVLVTGGLDTNNNSLASVELYNPASGTWSSTGPMSTTREYHTATLLPSGLVLVVEGADLTSGVLTTAELYNPVNGTWASAGLLANARANYTATLLPNGQVLAVGGLGNSTDTSTAELYNPANGTWAYTGSLNTGRYSHTATLLPNGKVLVAGGEAGLGTSNQSISSTELYDPATGKWSINVPLVISVALHTATLLHNGQVLVAGGVSGLITDEYPTEANATNELFNVGLGFSSSWQPQITSALFNSAGQLVLSGTGFRGISSASGGNGGQNSPSDCPVVQLRRLDNEQSLYLSPALNTSFSATNSTSSEITPFNNWALVTVFVNGIPSPSLLFYATAISPYKLTGPTRLIGGTFQFGFTNFTGGIFTVLASTNLALPWNAWSSIGSAVESPSGSGKYQFTDPQATNNVQSFYNVRSP